jgi:simple sugar transport system permease protein
MRELLTRLNATQERRLLVVIVLLAAILSLATPGFASLQNLTEVATSSAFSGILAAGLLVVLVAGGVDISFAATASITQYVALTLANHGHVGWLGLLAVCIGVGAVLGMVNAVLVSVLKLSSIIVTVATQSLYFGLLMSATKGQDIFALPDWFNDGVHWGADGGVTINLQIVALAAVFVFTWWVLARTNLGRQIFALGGNPEAARRVGFNVFGLNLLVYGYMGVTAGIASLVHAQMVQSVSPSALVGRELDVLAAVVLGGASITGGVGTVPGTVLGLVLLAIVQNGLALLGVSSYWSLLCTGSVIVVAVIVMARDQRRAARLERRAA